MEELTEAIRELTKVINKKGIFSKEIKPEKASARINKEEFTVTFEDLRAVLAVLTRDGKQQEVKKLITEYGAAKLSDVPEEKYQELLDKAREI